MYDIELITGDDEDCSNNHEPASTTVFKNVMTKRMSGLSKIIARDNNYIDVLFHNIHVIVGELANLSKSAVASSHVFEMIDKVETPISDEIIPPISGNVEFKDVSFYYKDGEYVLKNINFIAQKGQVVA